jgi:hypothetical protein
VTLFDLRPLALSVAAVLATAPAALALDAADFASKLATTWTASSAGVSLKFGAGTVSGNDITYDGFTLVSPASGAPPISSPIKLTFVNVSQQADGGYIADSLKLPDGDFKVEGGEVLVKNIILRHIYVPGGKPTVIDASRIFGDASVGPIQVIVDGTPAFNIDSISVSNTFKPSQTEANLTEIDSTGVTSGLKFDMSGDKDQEAVAQAKALGLATVTGKALETVSWSLGDGHLNISEVSVDLDKIGKLKFSFDMTGYTPAFVQNLSNVIAAVGKASASGNGNQQAATAQLLASLQTLFLNSASIRFDDASITEKLLDLTAQQAKVDRAAFVDQLVAQIPASMAEGESNPPPIEVIKMVQAATRAYLTNPHSIEVRLAPKAPLGVLGIVAAAMAPANVAETIGLKVLVNDREITTADADKETGVAVAAPSGSDTNGTDDNSSATDNSSGSDNSSATDSSGSGDSGATDDSGGDNSGMNDSGSGDDTNAGSGSDASGQSGESRLDSRHGH